MRPAFLLAAVVAVALAAVSVNAQANCDPSCLTCTADYDPHACASCDGAHSLSADNACACPTAGDYGATCQCSQPTLVDQTDNPLTLVLTETKFIADQLHVVYLEAYKYYGTTPVLHSAGCASAFSWTVTDDEASCSRKHTGIINWASAYNQSGPGVNDCGLTRTVSNVDGSITFLFDFAVQNYETLPALRGDVRTRTLLQKMPFEIIFPVQVNATSSSIDVFAPVLLIAGVTKQQVLGSVASASPLDLYVELSTSVQWPFQLSVTGLSVPSTVATLVGSASDVTASPSTSCAQTTTGALCDQVFAFTAAQLVQDPPVCFFDGTYQFSFSISCRTGRASSCPLDSATDTATVSVALASSNMCPTVADNIVLTGNVYTWEDAAFTTSKSDFLDTQKVYVSAPVSSAKASINESVIWSAVLKFDSASGGASFTLVSAGSAATTDGTALGVVPHIGGTAGPGGISTPWLSFVVHTTYLGLSQDQIKTATLTLLVRVQYTDAGQQVILSSLANEGAVEYVELLSTIGNQDLALATQVGVGGSATSSSGSSKVFGLSQAQAGGIIVGGVALVAIVVVAAVAVHYRRRERMLADAVSLHTSSSESTLVSA